MILGIIVILILVIISFGPLITYLILAAKFPPLDFDSKEEEDEYLENLRNNAGIDFE